MVQNEFKYNKEAHYTHAAAFKKKEIDLVNQTISVTSDQKDFKTSFPNLTEKYTLPYVKSDMVVQRWRTDWMKFWQNQLNFAIWVATTGCGVDFNNHLKADGMIGSLYRFHVYYQIRRILFEMKVALPQEASWNAFDNSYDRVAYERVCKEFSVDINADWRQKQSDNQGLGRIYNYWSGVGYHPFDLGVEYDKKKYSFTQATTNDQVHIDYMAQGSEANNAWTTFILDNSKGLTTAGVVRINDSIRTYCWAILGSQSQTRTDILGTGTAFDAQKQFLANIEDAINSPVDLPSQITRYENTLKYARSKVDFVYGIGLYMSPSNMELQIGTIQGYNNEIVIATDSQDLGLNDGVNAKPVPPKQVTPVQGTVTPKTPSPHLSYRQKVEAYAHTHGHSQHWIDGCAAKPYRLEQWIKNHNEAIQSPTINEPHKQPPSIHEHHENKKTALIVGGVAVGIIVVILYKVI